MRSLFLRIFLWFCASTALFGTAVLLLFVLDAPETLVSQWRRLGRGAIVSAGRVAVDTYERGGEARLGTFLGLLSEDTGMRAALLDRDGRVLGGSPPPADGRLLDRLGSRAPGDLLLVPSLGVGGVRLAGRTDAAYRFVTTVPHRERRGWARPLFALFLLLNAVLCLLLARHLTSPVVHLRAVTSRFAGGDHAARVSMPGLLTRKDEVGGLARDFNELAARIESLLAAQKRLIADASHELRSPLTRLTLTLGLLRRNGDASVQASLARMDREVERLNGLITQLLTLSRLEGLRQPVSVESIDLGALVAEVVADADFEAASEDKSVRLVESVPCRTSGSPDVLRSAFENIVRNAVRYTASGTSVQVRLTRPDDGGSTVAFVVEDEGPGVPEEDLAFIFQPFYRVDTARERQSGGAGLGLAIARQAVDIHGGTITAANRPGGGLQLRISLPLDRDRATV